MKRIICILIALFLLGGFVNAEAQVTDPEKVVKKKSTSRTNKKVDEGVDKGLDKLEEGIGSLFGKKKKKKKEEASANSISATVPKVGPGEQKPGSGNDPQNEPPLLTWAKYDFVPGDKVIFEDNLEIEENGEFPSRWDMVSGTIENAEFGGDKIIMFRGGTPAIIPYLKNPVSDYLPEVFTVEFDLYVNNHNNFQVFFYDRKNQRVSNNYTTLDINYNGMRLSPASSRIPDKGSIENQWAHISIAYTNGKMKAYINDTRLINIPHLEFDPMGITLYAYHASDQNKFYVKNFRLAEGGIKYYDRFLQDGKIVSNGIRFDTGKSTLRPESMGVINEIFKMLEDHPEVNVSVEGHTDSDGELDFNQTLSEARAKTVVNLLIAMGIDAGRLSSQGFGESQPLDANDTPEGKANNRRVEFVKK